MKIRNPNFKVSNAARIAALQGKLMAYLVANAGVAAVDFAAVRADIGPADLTDGEITQAAQDAGLVVVS